MNHHAYYIEGRTALFEEYKKELLPFVAQKFERLGIEEARELTERASLKNVGGTALFLIAAASLTTEAQQALLKLFEEPQEGTVFVLIIPHGALLPTLRSRMLPYPTEIRSLDSKDRISVEIVRQFLKVGQKERSELVAKLLKDEDGAKERARDLIQGLEAVLYARFTKAPTKDLAQGLEDIASMRSYLGDRSASLKMLLEHLAVSLPTL